MRILGVDPGLAKVGWGMVEQRRDGRMRSLGFGVIRTSTATAHSDRLLAIFHGISEQVRSFEPDALAIEEIFHGKNARSALVTGEGRGACIVAGANHGIRVTEYSASKIKLAVTGNGRAAKIQVQNMVARLLGLDDLPRPADAADALAVAITHLHRQRPFQGLSSTHATPGN